MQKGNPWKFQSNQKLSSKMQNQSNSSSHSIRLKRTDSITVREGEDYDFASPFTLNLRKPEEETFQFSQNQKQQPQMNHLQRLQELQRRSRQREQAKKNRGLAGKMKIKIQEQIKLSRKMLEEKESELNFLNVEIVGLSQQLRQRKIQSQDIANKQQMLVFKENQLNNLMTIHSQILQGAKREVSNQKILKNKNQERIKIIKCQIAQMKNRWREKQETIHSLQKVKQQKKDIEAFLQSQKQLQIKNIEVKSEAIRQLIHELINKNKRELEEECQDQIRLIRQACANLKEKSNVRPVLTKKGFPNSSYYTYNQLKFVPELNFRVNKQAQMIMNLFYKIVHPKIPQIIDHIEEPLQLIQLKDQLKNVQKKKLQLEMSLRGAQDQIQDLEVTKNKLQTTVNEIKKKNLPK